MSNYEERAQVPAPRRRRLTPTRVSANGQVVLPVLVRRLAGIEAGDLVVAVPLGPGSLVVEKVAAVEPFGLRRQLERADNPLRGVWGSDPDRWLEELRGRWSGLDHVS